MNLVKAHGRLATIPADERGELLPDPSEFLPGADFWPAFATAFASLSGGLEDAGAWAELAAAVRHGVALVEMEVISPDEVAREFRTVVDAVRAWGDRNVGMVPRSAFEPGAN